MRTFKFTIADSRLFTDESHLPSDEAAWNEALQLTRDLESSLKLNGDWVLTVSEGDSPIFRISVTAHDLRTKK